MDLHANQQVLADQQLLQVQVLHLPRLTTSAVSGLSATFSLVATVLAIEYPPNCGGWVPPVSTRWLDSMDSIVLCCPRQVPPGHAWTHNPSPQHTFPKSRRPLPRLHRPQGGVAKKAARRITPGDVAGVCNRVCNGANGPRL